MPNPMDLADANMLAVSRVTNAVQDFVTRSWWALGEWHDPAIFTEVIVPHIIGAQIQIAALTDAYLSALMTEVTGSFVAPVGPPPEQVSDLRAHVTLAQAYERPFVQTWYKQAQGSDFSDALNFGLQRARAMISIDMQLARTHASALILQNTDGVKRYQRVLSGSENCDICKAAARHIYKVNSLMPIHTDCDCTVFPVIDGYPPLANRINEERSTSAFSDKEDRIPVKDPTKFVGIEAHQELGPMLVTHQATYPTFNPLPDGTWDFTGRTSQKNAPVEMFGSKAAADRLLASSTKEVQSP